MLVLLNGPPASGKSTIAGRLIARRPLALNLDVDVIRSLLGDWKARPADAGIAARRLAVAMALEHLAAGNDVVVPQFLARAEFIEQLSPPRRRIATPPKPSTPPAESARWRRCTTTS